MPKDKDSKQSQNNDGSDIIGGILQIAVDAVVVYGMYKISTIIWKALDSIFNEYNQYEKHRNRLAEQLHRSGRDVFNTNYYEDIIAGDLVDPTEIDITFDQIGGLDKEKRELYELVVLPLRRPELFKRKGNLMISPKGILLYGVPGTGKTLLAKAIAKESGAFFINLKISTIMSKYLGEPQKLVNATFSLAHKLSPCIIFIDEIDSFMGERSMQTDQHVASMKTEFMALWDGFSSTENRTGLGVIVLGATNRPGDVDDAFLRRMPRAFNIGLPNMSQRISILKILLDKENCDESLDFKELSMSLEGYSGSDLKELCRAALMIPLREYVELTSSLNTESDATINLRALTLEDFQIAKQNVPSTSRASATYSETSTPSIDPNMMSSFMMAAFQQIFQMANRNYDNTL